jgi:hypothetical protein
LAVPNEALAHFLAWSEQGQGQSCLGTGLKLPIVGNLDFFF